MLNNNVVLYRKYRPQNFSEIIGQEHIIETLKNALRIGRISHAYLFSGPRGTGKTTVARILAKAVNCFKRQSLINNDLSLTDKKDKEIDPEPCNKCDACIQITEGRAMDLIEIDAASSRGIDEIRELRESVKFVPSSFRYKIYIIDEVHMLTKEAFNALLKTLEEPPPHVIFILATTEFYKLLPTIVSRCQVFQFKKLTKEEIIKGIEKIKKLEKFEVEDGVLEILAKEAQGSLRDAESMLERLLAHNRNYIKLADAYKNLDLVGDDLILEFLKLLSVKDIKQVFNFIDNIVFNGIDIAQFIKNLTKYSRIIFYAKIDKSLLEYFNLTQDEEKFIIEFSNSLTEEKIKKIIDILFEALDKIKITPIPQLPLELAVVEIINQIKS